MCFCLFCDFLLKALSRTSEQATGEDETLVRLQLDELKANISSSEVELHKLNGLVEFFFAVTTG